MKTIANDGFAKRGNQGLTKVADVVVSLKTLGHADVKLGLAGYAEAAACARGDPGVGAVEFVVAATGHALHDLGRAGVEGQGGRQDHADRFFSAVRQGDAVADAFAAEIDIGLGGDGAGE